MASASGEDKKGVASHFGVDGRSMGGGSVLRRKEPRERRSSFRAVLDRVLLDAIASGRVGSTSSSGRKAVFSRTVGVASPVLVLLFFLHVLRSFSA